MYASICLYFHSHLSWFFSSTTLQASLVKVGHLNADTFMGFLAVSCMFAGAATSALQGGMFGLAGLLPGVYTQSLLLGQALAGLIVAGLNVLFLRGGVDLGFNPAFVYFITSCIVAFFALFAFVWVVRTPVMKYYAQHDTVESSPAKPKEYEIRRTFDAIYDQLLIVGYNFFITLLVFPSLTSKIIDHNQWLVQADGTNLFVPVFTFLLFNLGDVVGRTLSAYGNLFTAYNLRYAVLVRTLFVPAFLLCDVKFSIVSAVLFNSDLWYILFMILFSVSSGYLGAQCMMFGPQCADVRDRECAGTMMAFSLTIGLLIGSWLSFLLIAD
ncbi:hypothetical protein SARC_02756 [Sphaeroforma arctica JP610]|uniref:Nucleoside transporter n=1 Tax=Sphaeroforma arctica JP610 TaxID=667725 RepID=A0A0L0GA07_9EUKA|nr:hypothetical protein SARC_02756 [Sphaeroforma arctica JP610]KNC85063.1 hypothetical protein SARC_02756 [Sphaeroforma arctica JP610]|eukprot:XP_014158965.1 hypothetical protein SARC_02756 [Sphaeroforma arctica JP610]